jgi:hypothetical protein
MNGYTYIFNFDDKQHTLVMKEELSEHLKRHWKMMIENNRSSDDIVKWFHNRGYEIDYEVIPYGD